MGCSAFLGPGVSGHPAMVYSANDLGSLVLDVDGNVLQARFLRDTGAMDDYFVIIKGSQPPPARVIAARMESGRVQIAWQTVQGFRYRVFRRAALTAARESVSTELLADGFELQWSEAAEPQRPAAFYEVETLAE